MENFNSMESGGPNEQGAGFEYSPLTVRVEWLPQGAEHLPSQEAEMIKKVAETGTSEGSEEKKGGLMSWMAEHPKTRKAVMAIGLTSALAYSENTGGKNQAVESEPVEPTSIVQIEEGSSMSGAVMELLKDNGMDKAEARNEAGKLVMDFAKESGLEEAYSLVHPGDKVLVEHDPDDPSKFKIADFQTANEWNLGPGYLTEPEEAGDTPEEPEDEIEIEPEVVASSEAPDTLDEHKEKEEARGEPEEKKEDVEQAREPEQQQENVMSDEEIAEKIAGIHAEVGKEVKQLGMFGKLGLVNEIKDSADDLINAATTGDFSSLEGKSENLKNIASIYQENLQDLAGTPAHDKALDDIVERVRMIETSSLSEIRSHFE